MAETTEIKPSLAAEPPHYLFNGCCVPLQTYNTHTVLPTLSMAPFKPVTVNLTALSDV